MSCHVEQIQVAAFFGGPFAETALSLWAKLLQGDPTGFSQMPAPLGGTQANGTFCGEKLVLQVQPGRVDFVLAPRDTPESQAPPAFEDVRATEKSAREIVIKALPLIRPNRIAIVLSAYELANDIEDMLGAFGKKFPGLAGAPNTTELFFQLVQNVPAGDAQGGPRTRIRRWQTQQRHMLAIDLTRIATGPIVGRQAFLLARYIDVSSQATAAPMTVKRATTAFNAVASDALELLNHDNDRLPD